MAERLQDFDFLGRRYLVFPWVDWIDGSIWKVTYGTDFDCSVKGFWAVLHIAARRHGKSVRTHIEGDDVIFQFSDKEAE